MEHISNSHGLALEEQLVTKGYTRKFVREMDSSALIEYCKT